MKVDFTLDDLPTDRASCANCDGKSPSCARKEKQFPKGMVKNSCTGNYDGIVSWCPHYCGSFGSHLEFDLFGL